MRCQVKLVAIIQATVCVPHVAGLSYGSADVRQKPLGSGKRALTTQDYTLHFKERIVAQASAEPRKWGPDDLVVVPAVFTRWGKEHENTSNGEWNQQFPDQPFWAYEDPHNNRNAFLYQRLWPDEPFYVPNYGYEGAIYLRFIVDHYENLPPAMAFVQDDYEWNGTEDCIARERLSYRPLFGFHTKKQNHACSTAAGPSWDAVVEQCWRDFAGIFELPGFEPKKLPCFNFYTENNFLVSRAQIRKRPLSQWRAAYETATRPHCHEGPLNMDALSDEIKAKHKKLGRENITKDTYKTKSTSGGALEQLATLIYGLTQPDDVFYWTNSSDNATLNCMDFMPRSICKASLCH